MSASQTPKENARGFHTKAAQTYHDGQRANRPLSIPIVQATTHQVESGEQLGRLFTAGADTFYTRFGNPTVTATARKLALLEGARTP